MNKNPPHLAAFEPVSVSQYDDVVTKMLASYQNFGGLNNSDSLNLPSKHAIGEICEKLLQLLFPGFHDNDVVHDGSLSDLTSRRLTDVIVRLEDQVRKSVRVGNSRRPTGKTGPIIQKFCKALHIVREILVTDIEAAYNNDPSARSHEEIILSYPFIEAISIQRLAHRLYRAGAPMIPRMMTEWAHGRTGIDIHPGASIGAHFFIDHGTGVVIGETCKIGNHCKIYHGVTLGARTFVKDGSGHVIKGLKRHPNLGDNVTVYPNSTILGGETTIGSNSTIGANVFLMHSVPADTLVIYEEKSLSILTKTNRPSSDLDWSI
ncbi:MAG: serine O-acetyltransferase EpsC [Luteolibacter sp.]|jgi:serine O-acetyltransferase|nr:serine O-acetyltransferase EpsC [Luteolibacter sp.]